MTISEKILLEKMGCTDQDALKDSQISTDTALEAMKEVAIKFAKWKDSKGITINDGGKWASPITHLTGTVYTNDEIFNIFNMII